MEDSNGFPISSEVLAAVGADGKGKELLTLQFGPFSNLIGAHFWNFQVFSIYFFFYFFIFFSRYVPPTLFVWDTFSHKETSPDALIQGELVNSGKASEEINQQVVFRWGETPQGKISLTPRLIVFDIKQEANAVQIIEDTQIQVSESG